MHAQELDLVFLPLVAFDRVGHRVGMGGGYYDRTFAFVQQMHHKPILIGLAYEMQQVDGLPFCTWDIPLDGVLTEKQLRLFQK